MRTPDIYLRSIGVHLPPVVSIETAVAEGRYPAEDREHFRLRGAAVAGDVPAPELALRAARHAFERSGGMSPRDLDLMLYADVWHQGPEGWQPQFYLQRHLVGGDVLAMELRQGCCGLFGALQLAAGYLRPGGTALLVGADNHGSPLVDRWRMMEGYVVGDGGCALLVTTEPGFAELRAVNVTVLPEAEAVNDGGVPMFPPDATVGRPLDFASRHREFRRRLLARDGAGVMRAIQSTLMVLVDRTLKEAGITLDEVARVAFPHGRWDNVEERASWLGLTLADTTWEYGAGIGHLGVSDQFVALDHLLAGGALAAGDYVLLVGVGAGKTLACAVLRIRDIPEEYASGRPG
ncbi:ketoacyl-ACP synthase III family protein [Nonomuraea roseoviolacea subsp. roseoviolacea]|uniref:3-oxoacyl-[acyl-carrier-protein] synthase-3 n=1 Tax=Nonomuraea roseoviolacea subsp. carminata TaxID=160689 RepID=A0ABT1JTJ5_9ACTN|nr:ketoacyl-ACP synthase III family protein [Nonomuraea roseoviolacea]MCP2344664.1 3-oxoacyl-[acyl-carrier-protein] synthase-3 [Nonomuraea roseoviolacea subsp. carminata]